MLRILICDPSREFVRQAAGSLRTRIARKELDAAVVRVSLSTEEMRAYLETHAGVHYAVMNLMYRETAHQIRAHHRDSYLVFSMERGDRMQDAFEGMLKPCGLHVKPVSEKEIADLFESAYADYLQMDNREDVLTVTFGAHAHRIPHHRILYFEAAEKKLFVVTATQRIGFQGTLEALSRAIPEERFLRVHKGFIINRQRICEVDWNQMRVSLSERDWVPVSRTHRQALRDILSSWDALPTDALHADSREGGL